MRVNHPLHQALHATESEELRLGSGPLLPWSDEYTGFPNSGSNDRLTQSSRAPRLIHSTLHLCLRPLLGRPDRQTPMKGGRPMSSSPLPSIREDLQGFFQYCERLLDSARASDHMLFSNEDLKRICFYTNAVAKLADSQRRLEEHRSGNPDGFRLQRGP
jgi:hypothetical protein